MPLVGFDSYSGCFGPSVEEQLISCRFLYLIIAMFSIQLSTEQLLFQFDTVEPRINLMVEINEQLVRS